MANAEHLVTLREGVNVWNAWVKEQEIDFRTDLANANLRRLNLAGADLTGADLRGANLHGANLHGANLRDADLRDADLTGADLGGADLGDAILTGADFTGADLGGADLTGADLTNAYLDRKTVRVLQETGFITTGVKVPRRFPVGADSKKTPKFDVFLSYDAGMEQEVGRSLREELEARSLSVWSTQELRPSDSFNTRVEQQRRNALVQVFVVGPGGTENNALDDIEASDDIVIPVWHKVSREAKKSDLPDLAKIVGLSSEVGSQRLADEILRVVLNEKGIRQEEIEAQINRTIEIQEGAHAYVEDAIKELQLRETRLEVLADRWNKVGFGVLAGVLVASAILLLTNNDTTDWPVMLYRSVKSLVVLGVGATGARIAFRLATAYRTESLTNADRIHAISFGKFYLQIFGDKVEPTEMKEVFQHWNVSREQGRQKKNKSDVEVLNNTLEKVAKVIPEKNG